jgi:hypothetical protein
MRMKSKAGVVSEINPRVRGVPRLLHAEQLRRHRAARLSDARAGRSQENGETDGVVCRVTVTMTNDQHLETVARGRHAYGAIDRAADRIRSLMANQSLAVS